MHSLRGDGLFLCGLLEDNIRIVISSSACRAEAVHRCLDVIVAELTYLYLLAYVDASYSFDVLDIRKGKGRNCGLTDQALQCRGDMIPPHRRR